MQRCKGREWKNEEKRGRGRKRKVKNGKGREMNEIKERRERK
jgi:hypothetical protein